MIDAVASDGSHPSCFLVVAVYEKRGDLLFGAVQRRHQCNRFESEQGIVLLISHEIRLRRPFDYSESFNATSNLKQGPNPALIVRYLANMHVRTRLQTTRRLK